MTYRSGSRSVIFYESCSRLVLHKKKWFGGSDTESLENRKLAILENPRLILILKHSSDWNESNWKESNWEEIDWKEAKDVLSPGDPSSDSQGFMIVETAIDPLTCKLRLSLLTTPTSIDISSGIDSTSNPRRNFFEIITPNDNILISAVNSTVDFVDPQKTDGFLETKTMEMAIGKCLYAAHCPEEQLRSTEISWKHQLVLGSLSSFVVLGSILHLEKAIKAGLSLYSTPSATLPSHIIDDIDESGRTALHYACAQRASASVAALIGAGADLSIPLPCEDGDILPIHFAAKMLDHMTLSTILSAPSRPDPNLLDSFGRTAMFIAATEGFSDDSSALNKCISALDAWGGTMGPNLSTVSVLVSNWRHDSLSQVLANLSYRYPLTKPGISAGAFHHYPIHTALITLRGRIKALAELNNKDVDITTQIKTQLKGTLVVLLEHGFEPNERIESIPVEQDNFGLQEYIGFSPIQILAVVSLEIENLSKSDKKISSSLLSSIAKILASAADILVQSGARINLDSPPLHRVSRNLQADGKNTDVSLSGMDRNGFKIEGNKDLIDLLGGKERLEASRKMWLDFKVIASASTLVIPQTVTITESKEPGGSSDKSCAICWSIFGTIINRKHKCRISCRFVCDECSTKRIKFEGNDHRLSDGQFLLARADLAKEKEITLKRQQETLLTLRKQREQFRLDQEEQEKQDLSQRESLFGGLIEKASSFLSIDGDLENTEGLQSTLQQTRDAIDERGHRLNSLSEKTEKLMNASEDFAKMAKELERSQNSLFW